MKRFLGSFVIFLTTSLLATEMPMRFEENLGQWPEEVLFEGRNGELGWVRFTRQGLDFGTGLKLRFKGANKTPIVFGDSPTGGKSAYYVGNNTFWAEGVRHFSRIVYQDAYPGIDIVYYIRGRELEYDFIVQPGVDPSKIKMLLSGYSKRKLMGSGDLEISAPRGVIVFKKPISYQRNKALAQSVSVSSGYKLRRGNLVAFQLGQYDKSEELVIDPTARFGSGGYLKGVSFDVPLSVDHLPDSRGAIRTVVAGYTQSNNFQTSGSGAGATSLSGTTDGYITVFSSPSGTPFSNILFSAYFGGSGTDVVQSVKFGTDANGDINAIYAGGYTNSSNFPWSPAATTDGYDGFVLKLTKTTDSTYSLAYATQLKGASSSFESVSQIALNTISTNCTTAGSPCVGVIGGTTTTDSSGNAFFVQLASNGTTASAGGISMKEFGSTGAREVGKAIFMDTSGNAVIAGETQSSNLNTWNGSGSKTTTSAALVGTQNIFVARLSSSGTLPNATNTATNWAVLLTASGSGVQTLGGLSKGDNSAYYVSGTTNVALAGGFSNSQPGALDVFVEKISTAGAFSYGKYIGGTGDDIQFGHQSLFVDATAPTNEVVYLTGSTSSSGFISTSSATTLDQGSANYAGFGACRTGGTNAFLSRLRLESADSTYDYTACLGSSTGTTSSTSYKLPAGLGGKTVRDIGSALVAWRQGPAPTSANSTVNRVAVVGLTQSYVDSAQALQGGFPYASNPTLSGTFTNPTANTVDSFFSSVTLCTTANCHTPGGYGYQGYVLRDVIGVSAANTVRGVAIDSDGKIVKVGQAFNGSRYVNFIVRHYPDGELDYTFGTNGIVQHDPTGGTNDNVLFGVAHQADGKIIVAGYSGIGGSATLVVSRFTKTGALDTSFGSSGNYISPLTNSAAQAVTVDASGNIIAVGYTGSTAILIRLTSSGVLDTANFNPSFGYAASGSAANFRAVGIDGSGKYVAVGVNGSGNPYWERYTTAGVTEQTCQVSVGATALITSLSIDSSNRYILAGQTTSGGFRNLVLRTTSACALDTAFNTSGYNIQTLATSSIVNGVRLQADGKIVAAGYIASTPNGGVVERYTTTGTLDSTFGTSGRTTTSVNSASTVCYALAIHSDDKIICAGDGIISGHNASISLRHTASGAVDQ